MGWGAVLNWLDSHLIPVSMLETDGQSGQAHFAQAYWTEQIPALIVDDHLIGFFRSLPLERDFAGYQIFRVDPADDADGIRAFDVRDITRAPPSRSPVSVRFLEDSPLRLQRSLAKPDRLMARR